MKASKAELAGYTLVMAENYGSSAMRYTRAVKRGHGLVQLDDHWDSMRLRTMLAWFSLDRKEILDHARKGVRLTREAIARLDQQSATTTNTTP